MNAPISVSAISKAIDPHVRTKPRIHTHLGFEFASAHLLVETPTLATVNDASTRCPLVFRIKLKYPVMVSTARFIHEPFMRLRTVNPAHCTTKGG
jgi:hypothetical protein